MSVSFQVYAVKTSEVAAFVGSEDDSRLAHVKKELTVRPMFGVKWTPEIEGVLKGFLNGQFSGLDKELAHQSLRILCAVYGELEDCDMVTGVSSGLLEELGSGVERLFDRGCPFPTGELDFKNVDGNLAMGYLRSEELPPLLNEMEGLLENFPEKGDFEVRETLESVHDWYARGVESGNDLVGFWC